MSHGNQRVEQADGGAENVRPLPQPQPWLELNGRQRADGCLGSIEKENQGESCDGDDLRRWFGRCQSAPWSVVFLDDFLTLSTCEWLAEIA